MDYTVMRGNFISFVLRKRYKTLNNANGFNLEGGWFVSVYGPRVCASETGVYSSLCVFDFTCVR